MRKTAILTAVAVLSLLVTGGSLFAGNGSQNGNGPGGNQPPVTLCPLDQEEIDDLMHMRQEEKLARDVYFGLYVFYNDLGSNASIFSNIAESERTHMDALGKLIAKYADVCELTDPVADPENIGAFEDEQLGCLYDILINAGQTSFEQALWVGDTIEDLDIVDLNLALYNSNPANEDLRTAYLNLTKGSRNHLRAFTSQDEDYDNFYMCEDLFEAILDTPAEHVNYTADDLDDPESGLSDFYFDGWQDCVKTDPRDITWCQ